MNHARTPGLGPEFPLTLQEAVEVVARIIAYGDAEDVRTIVATHSI
jgi:hypothetical protein